MLGISVLSVERFGPVSHTKGAMACAYHEKVHYPTHCDLYLQVPSQQVKKPHCFQMKVTLYLRLPNLEPTQGCQNVMGRGPSASAHGLWDSGELRSSAKRDSSFLHSTPGVVPSIPTHI